MQQLARRFQKLTPWIALCLLLLAPIYAVTIAFAIRADIFNLSNKQISDGQFKALWAFIASGLGTAAAIVGFLLQRETEKRNELLQKDANARLALDSVVKSLELLVESDGKYAQRAKIAGALATLVHLGHPVIAMSVLAELWLNKSVGPNTGTWLISETFKRGSDESKREAAALLRLHANELCSDERKGMFYWPRAIRDGWLSDLPADAKRNILISITLMVTSREKAWWERGPFWVMRLLDDAVRQDNDATMRYSANELLKAFLTQESHKKTHPLAWPGEKSVEGIEIEALKRLPGETLPAFVLGLKERIQAWGESDSRLSPPHGEASVSPAGTSAL